MNKENIEGLPFVVTRKSKTAKFEQAVSRLMSEIVAGEESVGEDGWIDEADVLSEVLGESVIKILYSPTARNEARREMVYC